MIEQTTNQASVIELAAWLTAKNPVVSNIHHQIIVAGVVERDGRYLVIEEMAEGRRVINQPAGRLEKDESASDGAMRETLEESDYLFMAEALVGLYHWFHPEKTRFICAWRLPGNSSIRVRLGRLILKFWLFAG